MFKHPLEANTSVTNIDGECIQPNGMDLRIDRVFMKELSGITPVIRVDGTTHGAFREVTPIDDAGYGIFYLEPGFYQFETEHEIHVARGEMGWLKGRSSLVRNGAIVFSGVFDTGFQGTIGGVLQVNTPIAIENHARVCQLLITPAQSVTQYDGQYQNTGVVT